MSKARSPRDVCSTTMGTSGLMVLALFRSSVRIPAGGPQRVGDGSKEPTNRLLQASALCGRRAPDASGLLRTGGPERLLDSPRGILVGRPQLPARAGLLDGERPGVLGQHVDRLALGDLLAQVVEAPGLVEAVAQLLGRRALARGRGLQGVEHVAVGRVDALGLDDGGDDGLAAQRALGVGARLGEDLVLALAGDLQVALACDPLVAERVHHAVPQLAGARLDERVGHLDRRVVDDGVEHGFAELRLDALLVGLAQLAGDVLAQLVERVEAGGVGGEVVVELGQLLALDLVDGDGELRLAAPELLGAVVLGERDRDRALLARLGPEELRLEAGHEPVGAELDELVARLAARERLAVDRAAEVHDDEVAGGGGLVDGLQARRPLAQRFELALDRLVAGARLAAGDLDALVRAERRLRAHADLDREAERLALAGQVPHVQLRLADRADAGGLDRVEVPAPDLAADRFVDDGLAAHALDDGRPRYLAVAEAGHAQVAR